MDSGVAIAVVILSGSLILSRILYVIYWTGRHLRNRRVGPLSTLIVLGSGEMIINFIHLWIFTCVISLIIGCLGGHTAEMLNVLSVLQKDNFSPRIYIAAATDSMSLQKARTYEGQLASKTAAGAEQTAQFMQIYRSREVGQSYFTSIWTTLFATMHALWLMVKIRPQVILCNGPGTCIPLCAIAFLFKVIGIRWSSIFYIESIARVRRLSLSGLILYKLHMADQLFVQWPQLHRKYPRAHYVGRLM